MKKPVIMQVFQLTKETRKDNSDWPRWMHIAWNRSPLEEGAVVPSQFPRSDGTDTLRVHTYEGFVEVCFGDYILCSPHGNLTVVKPVEFEAAYDVIPEWMATD